MRTLAVGILAALGLAAPLEAQARRALEIGSPIRVVGFDVPGGVVTGMLAGATRDTVVIGVEDGAEPLRIPRVAITHLYVQAGRRSGAGKAALAGMFTGTAVGAVVAFIERNRVTTPAVFAVAGGAGGAMLGGLVGQYIFRVARWQEAPREWLDDVAATP